MKRGSALLIVLGMLSFMVVSAVAFSIFMRQGRLPSSFLRQRILARQLVKAGLAQAMSELDAAIGDAKYPRNEFPSSSNRNTWRNRVFMGTTSAPTGDNGAYADEETALKNTVSTFPLEGLAYIPPPLVNTVRYWARRSPAAAWKPLDYDSGRYAFCAINVSDYLDINRLRANVMRDSSPSNRISLAFLFENDNHTDWGSVKPKSFDSSMDQLNSSTYGRLVSLADYNLSLGDSGLLAGSGFKSPFCEYIKNPAGDGSFYGANEETAKRQKFVTDSWYPGSNTVSTALFLTEARGQPLDGMTESGLDPLLKNGSEGFNRIKQHLTLPECAALRDYIDEDNIPTSLAMPTLERVPMLTGLQLHPMGFNPVIEQVLPMSVVPDPSGKKRTSSRLWKLKGFEEPKVLVAGSAVYPFKRTSGLSEKSSYDVQVLVKAFLVPDGSTFENTRKSSSITYVYRPGKSDWESKNQLAAPGIGCMTLCGSGTANVKFGKTENDALITINPFTISCDGTLERPIYGTKKVEVKDEETGIWTTESGPDYNTDRFSEVGTGGGLLYQDDKGTINVCGDGMALKWQYYAWVRILDGANTVDMFPATIQDDVDYNGVSKPGVSDTGLLGEPDGEPLVPIAGTIALKLDTTTFADNDTSTGSAGGTGEGATLSIYCNDPRFNWAPEDWYSIEGGAISAGGWYNNVKPYLTGSEGRPNDIFQFVSNEGYLQSMGELQFLPLVRKNWGDYARGNRLGGSFIQQTSRYGKRPFATSISALANNDYMWKTRCSFGTYADWDKGGDEQDAYNWGISDTNGGAAVSPYADADLFMAALANTPYDYIVASEKENDADRDLEKNVDLCFNARSSEAKLEWTQLEEIAERIQQKFLTGENWEEWEEWNLENKDKFFGQTLENFHDVDRKFLFSYWRPCFANSQQLFIIFVRAEPTVIGGSSAGHTPSQLGARAVALVWREPVSSLTAQDGEASPPHRMRILFYHQFD